MTGFLLAIDCKVSKVLRFAFIRKDALITYDIIALQKIEK